MANAIKQKIVTKLTDELKSSDHVFVTDYLGMKSEDINELRAQLRPLGVKYQVVKNRLAKVSLNQNGWTGLESFLKGPSAIAFKGKDIAAIAKVLFNFSETKKVMKVRAGRVFGSVESAANLKAIANLPSKEVLLATLLARLNSPLQSLAATLNEPLRSIHGALSALAKKKESAAA